MENCVVIDDILALGPVMPVIVIPTVDDAVPLAKALVAGGIRVLEVTLRTPAALDGIRLIRQHVPDAVVGVGTVTKPADLVAAQQAGAVFGVSPGLTPVLQSAILESGLPFLPGVATASEAMTALEAGFQCMKLFPAQQAGGLGMLKALYGPLPQARFCPTGGVDLANAAEFLKQPNVACVGGSWLAPAALVQQQRWDAITEMASQAVAQLAK